MAADASEQTMAAPLIEAMVEEILLRFSPDDPESLVRAALVCKPWCRLVSDRGFCRRFREFHRTPPVLGLLSNSRELSLYHGDVVRFRPTASFPPTKRVHLDRRAIDARHGRVLLCRMICDSDLWDGEFSVWDPVSNEERVLPSLPLYPDRWNAAVLCAATTKGTCDHLDCSRGPLLVVVVSTKARSMFVHVYSSETGRWSEQSVQPPYRHAYWLWRSVLVGNELCFMLRRRTKILKYNLLTREISALNLPSLSYKPDVLTTTEDGRLGFAAVHQSRLYLWSREDGPGGNAVWEERRVIKLESLLPVNARLNSAAVVGFAAGLGIIFVRAKLEVFSIDLKSQLVRKVRHGGAVNIVPYMSFYTPEFRGAWASFVKD